MKALWRRLFPESDGSWSRVPVSPSRRCREQISTYSADHECGQRGDHWQHRCADEECGFQWAK